MRKLWRHQQEALSRYAGAEYGGLLFDCGLGKTMTATRIAEAKELPVLIIAPGVLCQQWADELTNRDGGTRITEKDWDVLVCTSRSRKTKKFRERLKALKGGMNEDR